MGSSLEGKILLLREQILALKELTPTEKRGKMEITKIAVTSPKSVPLYYTDDPVNYQRQK